MVTWRQARKATREEVETLNDLSKVRTCSQERQMYSEVR